MNISDVLVKKKNSESVIKMPDPLYFKEKIVMPAATVSSILIPCKMKKYHSYTQFQIFRSV